MRKVSDIADAVSPCPFCGKKPACPDWTCERLASVTIESDGSYTVEFVEPVIEFTPENTTE